MKVCFNGNSDTCSYKLNYQRTTVLLRADKEKKSGCLLDYYGRGLRPMLMPYSLISDCSDAVGSHVGSHELGKFMTSKVYWNALQSRYIFPHCAISFLCVCVYFLNNAMFS